MESLLTFDKNTMPMIYDIIRIVTIQVITQFLFVLNNNGTDVKFFNSTFLKTVIFLCLGILVYWLIVRKIIQTKFFTSEEEEDYQ
tara:strand:+ start:305 stop:559 length:255 start_codon:yes stop_codon:yes gene_type:complete